MNISQQEILRRLNEIFRQVFDNNQLTVNVTTTSNDIDKWDSISLANLIYMIEIDFKIEIDFSETLHWSDVGDICNCIESKIMNRKSD